MRRVVSVLFGVFLWLVVWVTIVALGFMALVAVWKCMIAVWKWCP